MGAEQYLADDGIAYAPHGAPTTWKLGNGVFEITSYNDRLQPWTMDATLDQTLVDPSLLTLTFGYGSASANNGNVMTQRMEAPGSSGGLDATQHYLYDGLNRLGIVTEGAAPAGVDSCGGSAAWCRDFGYDRYGNRAVTNAVNGGLSLATPTATSAYTASTNRLTSSWANYDAAGNISAFVKTGYEWSAFYDAENKQRFYCGGTTAACDASNADAEYIYDGEGNRVQKLTPGVTETYVYDAFGRLAAEYSTAGPSGTAGTYFRTTDHLGSTRLVTDGSGNVHDRRDFFPFGEKILASSTYSNRQNVTGYNNASPASAHLFTAKERDQESGLDYFGARYMSAALGRFTGADAPFVDQTSLDPQSWNLYGYVGNNPLALVDPTGGAKTRAIKSVIQRIQNGYKQIVVRHDKPNQAIGLKEARDRVQKGGEAVFDGRGGAAKAAGKDAIYHEAHAKAGEDALGHLHSVKLKKEGNIQKKSGHAFIRNAMQKVIIPGATVGTTLFGDNALGATIDFVNPAAELQDVFEILETSVIPTVFGLFDQYLLSAPTPEESREVMPNEDNQWMFGCPEEDCLEEQ